MDALPEKPKEFSQQQQNRIREMILAREKDRQLNFEYATKVGLRPDGEPLSPDDAITNTFLYGAESPQKHYCSTFPLISLPDLADTWKISLTIVRGWAIQGKWEERRAQWLKTIPIEHGGTRASGDMERMKEFFTSTCLTNIFEATQITMERMRYRHEQEATKEGVYTIDKTSTSHNADVNSLKTLVELGRMTFGMPTKFTFSAQHSTSQRHQVNETVIHRPSEDPAKGFDVNADINPPALNPMIGTQQSREFLAESTEIVEASYGDSDEEKSPND